MVDGQWSLAGEGLPLLWTACEPLDPTSHLQTNIIYQLHAVNSSHLVKRHAFQWRPLSEPQWPMRTRMTARTQRSRAISSYSSLHSVNATSTWWLTFVGSNRMALLTLERDWTCLYYWNRVDTPLVFRFYWHSLEFFEHDINTLHFIALRMTQLLYCGDRPTARDALFLKILTQAQKPGFRLLTHAKHAVTNHAMTLLYYIIFLHIFSYYLLFTLHRCSS